MAQERKKLQRCTKRRWRFLGDACKSQRVIHSSVTALCLGAHAITVLLSLCFVFGWVSYCQLLLMAITFMFFLVTAYSAPAAVEKPRYCDAFWVDLKLVTVRYGPLAKSRALTVTKCLAEGSGTCHRYRVGCIHGNINQLIVVEITPTLFTS